MAHYVALVHKDPDSSYGVSFPDLPGCVSAGDTVDEALANATEALRGHIEVTAEHGDPISPPRTIEGIRGDSDLSEALENAVVAVLPLLAETGQSLHLNITMSEDLVAAVDRAAAAQGLSRSGFLAAAAREKLGAGQG